MTIVSKWLRSRLPKLIIQDIRRRRQWRSCMPRMKRQCQRRYAAICPVMIAKWMLYICNADSSESAFIIFPPTPYASPRIYFHTDERKCCTRCSYWHDQAAGRESSHRFLCDNSSSQKCAWTRALPCKRRQLPCTDTEFGSVTLHAITVPHRHLRKPIHLPCWLLMFVG